MSISAIGNGGFNINFGASVQAVGNVLGSQGAGNVDPLALGGAVTGLNSSSALLGTQGNSSVNTANALATALLLGALTGGSEEDKKKSDPLAGAAVALLAYQAIMGLGQSAGAAGPSGALTAGAISAVGGFSAMA